MADEKWPVADGEEWPQCPGFPLRKGCGHPAVLFPKGRELCDECLSKRYLSNMKDSFKHFTSAPLSHDAEEAKKIRDEFLDALNSCYQDFFPGNAGAAGPAGAAGQ